MLAKLPESLGPFIYKGQGEALGTAHQGGTKYPSSKKNF